ncbi:hypothetical protein [Nonomuraea dietziae]
MVRPSKARRPAGLRLARRHVPVTLSLDEKVGRRDGEDRSRAGVA